MFANPPRRVASAISCALLLGGLAAAQQPQNPSPMVEHTRTHPRLQQETPPGRREALELGTLFLPARLRLKSPVPLLVFFHGGAWLPEVAAARNRTAVLSIQIGAGSGVYVQAFSDPQRFLRLLEQAEAKSGVRFAPITLGGMERRLRRNPPDPQVARELRARGPRAGD